LAVSQTYATWWIRQAITHALTNQADTIRVPLYKVEEIKRLGRIRRRMQQEGSTEEPAIEALAHEMKISVEQVVELLNTQPETISLDQPRGAEEEDTQLSDFLEDAETPEHVVTTQALQKRVRELLTLLSPVERRVIELRFGLIDPMQEPTLTRLYMGDRATSEGRELGLVPVGKLVRMSHEAVRKVEERALVKLAPYCENLRQ